LSKLELILKEQLKMPILQLINALKFILYGTLFPSSINSREGKILNFPATCSDALILKKFGLGKEKILHF